jgi:hypothetical protein
MVLTPVEIKFTTCCDIKKKTFCNLCLVQISEETEIISLYRIKTITFIMDTDCAMCEVKTN